jgi:geranylgeranylglycerol-phosphate geranylgeranyltransferase
LLKNVFWNFFKLVRLDYSLFGALGVILSGLLSGDLHGFQQEYLIAFFIVFFSAIGSFSINDYFDFEVDKKNSRLDRPLIRGVLTKELALITGLIAFLVVVLLSFLLNFVATFLILVSLPLFILYSLVLKKIFLVKNTIIAYAFVATILLGSLISDAFIESLIFFFALMGFIVGLAYEIMLDIGDVEGDKTLKINTIPTRFGLKTAARISTILYIFIIVLDPLPFFIMVDPRLHADFIFILLILVPLALYLKATKSLMQDQSKKNIFQLKKQLFLTMQTGSIVYLIGVLL